MALPPAPNALFVAAVVSTLAVLLTVTFVRLGHSTVPVRDGADVRFPGFNALRALAALGVLGSHALATSPVPGLAGAVIGDFATGVALFFVISGFLLYRPFAAALEHPERISVIRFLENRALRILPLYVVVVAVVVLATRNAPTSLLINALTFTGVYTGHDLLPVAWSLDDEAVFYLLLPPLYLLLLWWPRPSQRLALGAVLVTLLCVASLAVLASRPAEQGIAGGPLTKFHLFGFGMLLAALHSHRLRPRLNGLQSLLGLCAVAVALVLVGMAYANRLYVFTPLCGVAYLMLVAVVVLSDSSAWPSRLLTWRPLIVLGDASFGIYLWHEPIHHVLYNLGALPHDYVASTFELACCAVALATGTYYLVEKPALGMKKRWAAQPARREPAVLEVNLAATAAS